MASGPTTTSPTTATSVPAVIVSALVRTCCRKPAVSPDAQAAERIGNAASAIATPISDTGTLWKLRAKLSEVTLPAASVLATRLKNRNVSGSIGWLSILGSISRTNSWSAGICRSSRGLMRTSERRTPTILIARCSSAPITAPTAAARMPSSSWRSTVPPTIPRLYRIGASA